MRVYTMKSAEELNLILNRVNPVYWYDEKDNFLILLAMLKNQKLKLSRQTRGIILNEDDSIYVVDDFSFTLGLDFIVGTNAEEMTSKLDLLDIEIRNISAWNKLQVSDNKPEAIIKKHKFLLPMNISKQHWIALEIGLQFEQQDQNFFLSKDITVNVYDSCPMYGISNIVAIQNMLDPFLKKNKQDGVAFAYQGAKLATKKQTDTNSCGPITCKTIFDLVKGSAIPDANESYSESAIKTLRAEHILAVNDETFTAKQQNYVAAILRSKQLNGDAFSHAECIYEYIRRDMPDKLSDIFAMMQKLISADDQMQNVNKSTKVLAVSEYEALDKHYKEQLTDVKKWFNTYYVQLLTLNLLQNIFKTPEDRLPEADLEWVDGGKDTLVEVLKNLLKLPKHYEQKKLNEEQMQIAAKEQEAREALEKAERAKLITIDVSRLVSTYWYPSNRYTFSGTVTHEGYPHTFKGEVDIFGNYERSDNCKENIHNIYSYVGQFDNGKKVGRGKEQYIHHNLRITTSFDGERSTDGRLLDGNIKCILGDQMNNGFYLIYTGSIRSGKLNGRGRVCMADQNHLLEPIEVNFMDGMLLSTGQVSITSLSADPVLIDEEVTLEDYTSLYQETQSHAGYMKGWSILENSLPEELQQTLDMIKAHLTSSNIDNLVVIFPEETEEIEKIRAQVMEEHLADIEPKRYGDPLLYSPGANYSHFYDADHGQTDYHTLSDSRKKYTY